LWSWTAILLQLDFVAWTSLLAKVFQENKKRISSDAFIHSISFFTFSLNSWYQPFNWSFWNASGHHSSTVFPCSSTQVKHLRLWMHRLPTNGNSESLALALLHDGFVQGSLQASTLPLKLPLVHGYTHGPTVTTSSSIIISYDLLE
jgi:hypothetical protein